MWFGLLRSRTRQVLVYTRGFYTGSGAEGRTEVEVYIHAIRDRGVGSFGPMRRCLASSRILENP